MGDLYETTANQRKLRSSALRRWVGRCAVVGLVAPSVALAGVSYESARVVDVAPVYETVRYTVGKVMNRAEAWRSMASVIGHWHIRGYGFFSVENKETGEWVGRVGPWYPLGWPAPEIGWTILRRHWGNGWPGTGWRLPATRIPTATRVIANARCGPGVTGSSVP